MTRALENALLRGAAAVAGRLAVRAVERAGDDAAAVLEEVARRCRERRASGPVGPDDVAAIAADVLLERVEGGL